MPSRPAYGSAREELVAATLESLREDGLEGASVRKICERAGVSVGLVNYHFPSLQHLIGESYQKLALSILDQATNKASKQADNPREQLSIFLNNSFGADVMDRKVLRAWIVVWAMMETSEPIRAAHEISNQATLDFLQNKFAGLELTMPPRLAAIGLSSLIDGLWMAWCLRAPQPSFEPQDAISICERWIDAVII